MYPATLKRHLNVVNSSYRPTGVNSGQDSVLDAYINSLAISGRKSILSILNRCLKALGESESACNYPWHELRYVHVVKIRAVLLDMGYALSTVNLALAALRGMAQTAFNMGLLGSDELGRIRAVKRVKGEAARTGRALSSVEVKLMLGVAKGHVHKARRARDRAILLLACGAGLRAAELVSLRLDNFHSDDGKIRVLNGKGRKSRDIYLAKTVVSALKAWVRINGSCNGPLFSKISRAGNPEDKPLSTAGLTSILTGLMESAGVDKFTPHDLRRTFITRLLEQNVDINTVRQLAGHSDISTTIRYDLRGEESKILASRNFKCW